MASGTSVKKFSQAWWLPGGHSQTLWRKFSPTSVVTQVRERVEMSDGDFIDLDWSADVGYGDSATETVVFILHGLCGCSSSPYVLSLQSHLSEHGISSVVMNFRGCSGETNRLAKAYHSGISEDLEEVFSSLHSKYPGKKFNMVGYSLGANVLLKWLGENKSREGVVGAVAVSTPFTLAYCSKAMLAGASRIYGRYFVNKLSADFRQKRQDFASSDNHEQSAIMSGLGELDSINSIWEFDDQITAPLHGFENAEDYYNRCSSIGFVDAISTDTLLIQSLNDPLIPEAALPQSAKLPGNIELQLSQGGGHVGFISGAGHNWLENRILDFVRA